LRSFAYNIPKVSQTDAISQDRLAAAFGGLDRRAHARDRSASAAAQSS
jgi:hypothetical protein